MHVYMYVRKHVCMYVCIYMWVHMCVYACANTYMHTCVCNLLCHRWRGEQTSGRLHQAIEGGFAVDVAVGVVMAWADGVAVSVVARVYHGCTRW